jgi:CheY-like chemotaxis protein
MHLKKIMIVDDDDVDTYLSKRVLSENDFTRDVVTASSVKEAIDYLTVHKTGYPEIIFLDLNMPGQNGLDFLDAFNALPAQQKNSTQIILLMNVVNSNDDITAKATSHPLVYHVIEKPLTAEKLRNIPVK